MNLWKLIKAKLTKPRDPSSGRGFFFMQKTAGVKVDQESALTYSAVWRAINLISQQVSILPCDVMEKDRKANGNVIRSNLYDHPVAWLLDVQPNEEMTAQTFKETLTAHCLGWGNGYAEIERDLAGRVFALWPIEPDRVDVIRDNSGRIVYRISNGAAPYTYLDQRDMFHLKGLGFDGITGYSVISYAARSIGLGIAAETFGSAFFANGANPGGVLEHPGQLSEPALKHLRESLDERHAGPGKAMRPMILEEGMAFKSITIPQRDAQFLESRQFNVTDIARWYGVPPHKLMEMSHATFSNIEHQNIEFVVDALMPWIKRWEQEARIKLIAPRNQRRIEVKFNVKALMRGDSKSRAEYYKTMSNIGVYSVNDILELEDMNPIGPDGDKRLVQINQTTLEKIGEEQPAPAPAPNMQSDNPQEENIEEVANKIFNREHHRLQEAIGNYKVEKDFEKWLNRFTAQHRDYVSDHTAHMIKNQSYVDQHIETMRETFWNVFYKKQNNTTADDYVREFKRAMQ